MKGMSPTGSQTQWSPEKATSIGHGFAADVWAAVCILVHMLSGHPPWTQRFPGAQMLHFVIFMQSPPLDDIPANVQEVVRDLITQGFTVDPKLRPSAAKLLKHPAFKVLEQGAPTSYYSTLKSTGQPLPDNQLGPTEASGPQELEEILSQVAPHGARQPSLSERRLPSVQFRVSGEGSSGSDLASSLAKHSEGSLPSSSSQPQDENDGPRPVAPMAGAASVVPIAGVGSTGRHSISTAEAPGAQEHHSEEGNEASSEEHPQELRKLPTFLRSSLDDIPDGVPGDTWSFSQLSFEDTDQHIHSFLSDVVPVVEFLPSSQALPEYRPAQRIPLSLDNMPHL
ncbi:mitogen-activated protein kinase kinase kinase A-like [Haliotis rubra]|uniref:mitogen-activated protein kinase kinase kinase A-like n=1 Tax=Haliotis rubra TaxID=36100 RepID=UPI001EE4F4C6|nr:mitogen-activated protein kinase kinase kinase A-like [Haliotis rubra]